jgi:hypothetical protein
MKERNSPEGSDTELLSNGHHVIVLSDGTALGGNLGVSAALTPAQKWAFLATNIPYALVAAQIFAAPRIREDAIMQPLADGCASPLFHGAVRRQFMRHLDRMARGAVPGREPPLRHGAVSAADFATTSRRRRALQPARRLRRALLLPRPHRGVARAALFVLSVRAALQAPVAVSAVRILAFGLALPVGLCDLEHRVVAGGPVVLLS